MEKAVRPGQEVHIVLVGVVGQSVGVLAGVEAPERAALEHGARVAAVLQHDGEAGQRHGHSSAAGEGGSGGGRASCWRGGGRGGRLLKFNARLLKRER